mgnify:CR=1 FL=1
MGKQEAYNATHHIRRKDVAFLPATNKIVGVMWLRHRQRFIDILIILLLIKLSMKLGMANLIVWGCYVYVRVPQPKKLDHCVVNWKNYLIVVQMLCK